MTSVRLASRSTCAKTTELQTWPGAHSAHYLLAGGEPTVAAAPPPGAVTSLHHPEGVMDRTRMGGGRSKRAVSPETLQPDVSLEEPEVCVHTGPSNWELWAVT